MADPVTKSQLQTNVQRFFLEFLTNFREPKSNGGFSEDHYYIEQAKTMVREKKIVLYVKLSHLEQVDDDAVSFQPADLRSVIETKYLMLRDHLNAAVPELLSCIQDKDLQDAIKKHRETNDLKFAVAFHDLPTWSGIRSLRAEKLGRLITIRGTVTRTSEVKPELLTATWECGDCRREVSGVEQQFKVTMPAVCPSRNCGNRTSWTLKPEARTTRWGDWQRIKLQENENEIKAGSMPRSLDVIVRDDMCDKAKPGDKIMVTGCLIVVPDVPSLMNPAELKKHDKRSLKVRTDSTFSSEGVRGLKMLGNRDLTYKMSFFGIFIDDDTEFGKSSQDVSHDDGRDKKMYLSQSDRDRFWEIAKHKTSSGKKDCFDQVARAIAPAVQGCDDVKKGILLMLIGGVPKRTDEGIKLRGDLNVCLLGDPATAKSALLKWVSMFSPRAVLASGKTTSAAGLTATVVRDMDLDQEKVIEPGALMLADNGVCCIDEFELMDDKDQVAIHEAMEQQTITLSKAGIQATLNARTSILASCLPRNTYYQPTQPLHKNVNMSPPIMSRFDLMFVMQDIHDVATDNKVAEHILALHRRIEHTRAPLLSQQDLHRYIKLAKMMSPPKLTAAARQHLIRCYKKLREDRTYVRGAAGVTVRQLESLIRLSEAIARVHLDNEVTVDYVKEGFRLQVDTLKRAEKENIDLNPEVGEDDVGIQTVEGDGNVQKGIAMPRKVKITYQEYQRYGQMLATHLAQAGEEGREVTEENLITWFVEQFEDEYDSEAAIEEKQHLVQLIINRLIEKDRVIIVARQSSSSLKPEQRVLVKHPNFPVGEIITGAPRT